MCRGELIGTRWLANAARPRRHRCSDRCAWATVAERRVAIDPPRIGQPFRIGTMDGIIASTVRPCLPPGGAGRHGFRAAPPHGADALFEKATPALPSFLA